MPSSSSREAGCCDISVASEGQEKHNYVLKSLNVVCDPVPLCDLETDWSLAITCDRMKSYVSSATGMKAPVMTLMIHGDENTLDYSMKCAGDDISASWKLETKARKTTEQFVCDEITPSTGEAYNPTMPLLYEESFSTEYLSRFVKSFDPQHSSIFRSQERLLPHSGVLPRRRRQVSGEK